jgi:hypothetical protein
MIRCCLQPSSLAKPAKWDSRWWVAKYWYDYYACFWWIRCRNFFPCVHISAKPMPRILGRIFLNGLADESTPRKSIWVISFRGIQYICNNCPTKDNPKTNNDLSRCPPWRKSQRDPSSLSVCSAWKLSWSPCKHVLWYGIVLANKADIALSSSAVCPWKTSRKCVHMEGTSLARVWLDINRCNYLDAKTDDSAAFFFADSKRSFLVGHSWSIVDVYIEATCTQTCIQPFFPLKYFL